MLAWEMGKPWKTTRTVSTVCCKPPRAQRIVENENIFHVLKGWAAFLLGSSSEGSKEQLESISGTLLLNYPMLLSLSWLQCPTYHKKVFYRGQCCFLLLSQAAPHRRPAAHRRGLRTSRSHLSPSRAVVQNIKCVFSRCNNRFYTKACSTKTLKKPQRTNTLFISRWNDLLPAVLGASQHYPASVAVPAWSGMRPT